MFCLYLHVERIVRNLLVKKAFWDLLVNFMYWMGMNVLRIAFYRRSC